MIKRTHKIYLATGDGSVTFSLNEEGEIRINTSHVDEKGQYMSINVHVSPADAKELGLALIEFSNEVEING